MRTRNNPAGRLYEILEKAANTQPGLPLKTLWAQIFDIPQDDLPLLFHKLIQLHKLVDETEEALRNIEGLDLELYLEPFPKIRQIISLVNLQEQSSTLMTRLYPADLKILRFCSNELAKHQVENVIEDDILRELLDEVNSLFEDVRASSLSEDVKTIILRQLEKLRIGIQDYRIRGGDALQEVFESGVGAIVINREALETVKDKDEVQRFVDAVEKVGKLYSFVNKTISVLEAGAKFIPLLLSGHR